MSKQNFPPLALTTWWKFNEQELMQFVGRDIIVFHKERYYILLKNASQSQIRRFVDENSHIIDLTSESMIEVKFKQPPDQTTNM